MGIFDFFASSGRYLSQKKLEKLLREMKILSLQEREYVKGVFSRFHSNGISKEEAKRAIRELKFNFGDKLDSAEVERVRQKLLGFFA